MARLVRWVLRILVVLAITPAAVLARDSAPRGERVTLQLKWHHQFQFAGYYAAQAQGYYAQEGLDVIIQEGDAKHPPIREVLAGRADFGVSDADVLLAYLQGKPLVALGAIFQHSPYILMTRADSGIRTPSDLRGKTIMLEAEQGIVQIKAMFKREGMRLDAVKVLPHTWNNQDLIDGRVAAISAYSTVEPYQLRAKGVEPRMIRAMDYGVDFYGDTLFTTQEQVEQDPDRVEAFRRASFKGWEYAMAHPEEIIELILKRPGVQERGITRELLRYEASAMHDLVLPGLVDVGHMNPGRWETMARIYVDIGIIPRVPADMTSFLFNSKGSKQSKWMLPVLIGLGAAVLGGASVLLWNLHLKQVVSRRTAELREAKAVAEEASRAKDHFLAVLSHELRTPLTPVVASLSMLQKDPRLDTETQESLEMIRRNVELEARLIDDLLDLTRIARGKIVLDKKAADLCTVLLHVAEVCRSDIEAKNQHLGIELKDGPHAVDGDWARLQQVFWNLLKNAIKFTPAGGCIGIRCYGGDHGRVIAEVVDNGVGIEPDALPRIFNAFEQASDNITRQFGGLGLGLAISKRLVEMHGGTISVQSEGKDRGAVFRVELPVTERGRLVAVEPAAAVAGGAQGAVRILLVEDHGDTARIMGRLLRAAGHQVQIAGDARQAMELASAQEFDLLISDLGLPDRSGLELIQELRQGGNNTAGIALSGYGQEEDIRRSKEAGFAEHLTKPVNFKALEDAIGRVLGQSRKAETVAG